VAKRVTGINKATRTVRTKMGFEDVLSRDIVEFNNNKED